MIEFSRIGPRSGRKKNIEEMAPPRNRLRQRHGPPREEIHGDFDVGKPMEAPKTRGVVGWNFQNSLPLDPQFQNHSHC